MPIGHLDHVGFTVSDLDRSIPFYEHLLGTEPALRLRWTPSEDEFVGRIIGYPGLDLEGAFFPLPGGGVLELLQYHHPAAGRVDMETSNIGNGHLGLASEDIHADYERLRDHVDFRGPAPVRIPSGPAKGGWAIYLRDPDGITVELVQAPPG
jgi:catechol 2,3-dioxygenase-like lactoylglutathione lyase family enzyme